MSTRSCSRLLADLIAIAVVCVVAAIAGCRATNRDSLSQSSPAPQADPLKDALARIEAGRGEPTGRDVAIEIPSELKHYSDRRKFLAIQTAQEISAGFPLPHDYSELAELIRAGELVEMPQPGEAYFLYGVGENATEGPFTHYDRNTGLSVVLCTNDNEFSAELARLHELSTQHAKAIGQSQRELRGLPKRERERKRILKSQIASARRSFAQITGERRLLEQMRGSRELREMLAAEKASIVTVASSFSDQRYNPDDPASRRELKMRLLRFLRPEARAELLEIARQYHDRFSRALPVSSVIRTQEYQRRLSEWNRSAARNASPPHVTGLAFDIYYRFMAYDEQQFLMSLIAGLKQDGRVEALREARDNIHVFTFANGHRPDEHLIAKVMSESRVARYSVRGATRQSRIAGRR